MGFPILVRGHLYIESGPWSLINGLVQEINKSSTLTMELHLSCTNPLIYTQESEDLKFCSVPVDTLVPSIAWLLEATALTEKACMILKLIQSVTILKWYSNDACVIAQDIVVLMELTTCNISCPLMPPWQLPNATTGNMNGNSHTHWWTLPTCGSIYIHGSQGSFCVCAQPMRDDVTM